MPLLRYRTGDWASLSFHGAQPALVGLEGRPPVIFYGAQGQAINNIDISTVLKPFGLAQYGLHQSADGSLRLRIYGAVAGADKLRETILALFGGEQALTIEKGANLPGKLIRTPATCHDIWTIGGMDERV